MRNNISLIFFQEESTKHCQQLVKGDDGEVHFVTRISEIFWGDKKIQGKDVDVLSLIDTRTDKLYIDRYILKA